ELDRATYFEEGYFDRFFEEMAIKCPKGTRVLLLFSNFCLISGITSEHPIEQALLKQNGTFQCIALYKEGVKQAPGNKKSWLRELREKEEVELFVIERV
ncbi:MAG: hypothetical protein RG741_07010, partial [Bacteroidales bacterium]|nr:hypothetical protein [Bacteroidales bacterium]